MSWRNDLEIIGNHVETGGVWAGDQICKSTLRKLRHEGYIGYDHDREVYIATKAGKTTWKRWRLIYWLWNEACRVKWRLRESIIVCRAKEIYPFGK
jgi:hypothetical protein